MIGSTGSGKTTLVNLIPRLFDVTGGAVTIDGVDVRMLDEDAISRLIAAGAAAAVPLLGDGRLQPALRRPRRHR